MQFYISAVACYNFELTISLFTATAIITAPYIPIQSRRERHVSVAKDRFIDRQCMRSSEAVRGCRHDGVLRLLEHVCAIVYPQPPGVHTTTN